MNEDLARRVEQLELEIKNLKSSTTIPFEVDRAFRDRFRDILILKPSSKNLDSEDQAVDESGSGTYSVLGDPDGFLVTVVAGTNYYIPYYD